MVNGFFTRKVVKNCKPKDIGGNIREIEAIDHVNE
jgi:hypothetical protein